MAGDDKAHHASVIRVTHFQPVAGKRDEFVTRIMPTVETMRTVKGCFGVRVCDVRETPNVIAVVSRWANQATLDKVVNAGTFNANIMSDLLVGPPTVEHLIPFAGGPGDDDD
jgi:quinol monooxygenase YgiN